MHLTNLAPQADSAQSRTGLALWMDRVLEECDRASVAFASDPVHDLRVALRRCRSLADGLIPLDPDPSWKQMKRAGKQLFGALGDLRDTHVMAEWVQRLGASGDPVTLSLLGSLAAREDELKRHATVALKNFDRKQWQRWSHALPRRAAKFRPGSLLFKHLALERWSDAYELHRRALRNRSKVAFHSLRIGIKRFRYIVENFLPQQHGAWKDDLKELQDLLGEVHDFDVLWATALSLNVFPNPEARAQWQACIQQSRAERIEKYRSKMLGENSLWRVWRAALPTDVEVQAAALSRLKIWAAALDPDFRHASHIATLSLQLFDGLPGRSSTMAVPEQRATLHLAALLHDVGRSRHDKNHHKITQRLVDRITPPLGVSAGELHMAGVIARYHRGALPRTGQQSLQGLSAAQRQDASWLGGILRLAEAFDAERDGRIRQLKVEHEPENHKDRKKVACITIAAEGYLPRDRMAESIAAARHLLETLYRRPILVKPMPKKRPRAA